jgi:glycosyltransferase involved in cell wall biosynthesis
MPGTAVVATLYDLIPLRYPEVHFPPRRLDQRLGYAQYLHLLQRADRIIAISAATRHDAVERLGIAPERIAVTPLAVDEQHFRPLPAESIDRVLTRHGLRRPYFLHVGASTFHKNTVALLRAFDLFRRRGGAHALYVAGRWTPRALARVRALYPDLLEGGHLRVLGFVADADLAAMYGGATALAYPSLIEGFGLPVLESMRCATPVLTSNTSSLPEVGGDAALYVDPHSPEEIAEGLRRLADDPSLRADLVERGLRHAQAFTWSRTALATLRIYQELL